MAIDVGEANFQQEVLDRSRELPVVVDFWAEWCGPCRVLGPVLERAAERRAGRLVLAKLDTDANQQLARQYGIQGIPAVKAFRDGQVVEEFVGALPEPAVEEFMNRLVPSEADELIGAGDEQSLRRALELEPARGDAAVPLARLLAARGEREQALAVLEPVVGDFAADGLAARLRLAGEGGAARPEVAAALEALDRGETEAGLAGLADAVATAGDDEEREELRRAMVGVFTELGNDHPLAREYRRRLATALY